MRRIFQNIDIPRFDIKRIQERYKIINLIIRKSWKQFKRMILILLNNDDPDS